jgi:hypothetical protein
MMKLDQGAGAIGLLVLATAFALLLTIGIPITISENGLKLSDFLSFSGNVLGACVTVIAAVIAWRAVQSQIVSQREATIFGILTRGGPLGAALHVLPGMRRVFDHGSLL